jgi:hypothetical protein
MAYVLGKLKCPVVDEAIAEFILSAWESGVSSCRGPGC